MAKKNEAATDEQKKALQKKALQKNGLPHYLWVVMNDFGHDLLVRNRVTGEVKMIPK